jgi:hypothetical protein
MDPVSAATAAMIAGNVTALVGGWLQQRARIRQEEAHRRLLVDVVHSLGAGGVVHDRGADGTCLTVAVPPVPLG